MSAQPSARTRRRLLLHARGAGIAVAAVMLGGCQTVSRICPDPSAERLAAVTSENRSLRRQLEQAQAKIKALTQVEQTLGSAPNGQENQP